MINYKKILFNGEVWAATLITSIIWLWAYVIFGLFTPYKLDSWNYVPNPSYDVSLGEVFVEECWREGHPAFGEYVCDYVDENPKYIVDPKGRQNEIYLMLFNFIFFFSLYSYVYNNKDNL